MIGTSAGQNLASPVQWLYIDIENYQLYEYYLANGLCAGFWGEDRDILISFLIFNYQNIEFI